MKTMQKVLIVLCCLFMAGGAAWAVDYSKMSIDELSRLRGTMYNVSQEEWNAFHAEWWKRINQMTPEQRQQYVGPGRGRGMGYGRGMGRGGGGYCCPAWGGGQVNQAPAAGTNQAPASNN